MRIIIRKSDVQFRERATEASAKEQSDQLPKRARRGLLVNNRPLIPSYEGFTRIVHEWDCVQTTRLSHAKAPVSLCAYTRSFCQHNFALLFRFFPHPDIYKKKHGHYTNASPCRTFTFKILFTRNELCELNVSAIFSVALKQSKHFALRTTTKETKKNFTPLGC